MTLLTLIGCASAAGLGGLASLNYVPTAADPGATARPAPTVDPWPDRVAADGVVEGARPEGAIRPEVDGILDALHVREGQDVAAGDLLAELRNAAQEQQVALATAEVQIARSELELLHNGERPERRRAMTAIEQSKHALYLRAKSSADRTRLLLSKNAMTAHEGEQDHLALLQAQAEWEAAAAERAEVEAPPRAEDVAIAQGRVAAAEARLALARAELAKTRLVAPTGGRVLRLYAEPGETAGPNTPQPVLLLSDLSRRRVRAFVEELDSTRVHVGQAATVTADGLPEGPLTGTVAHLAPRMGKRVLQSDEPGEYKDLYFREVLIDLDTAEEVPLNLRVKVRIQVGDGDAESSP